MLATSHKSTILVVDSDEPLLNSCALSLREANHRVLAATNGETALQYLSALEDPVDLMIVDLRLADMPGPDLVLRAGCICPVLFVSADEVALARAGAVASSWTAVLAKPFPTSVLLSQVARLLGRGNEPGPDAA